MDFANPGMSPERWSSYDTPHPVVAHHTAKFSWFCQNRIGVLFQERTRVSLSTSGSMFLSNTSGNLTLKLLPEASEGCLTSIVCLMMSGSFVL